MDYCNFIPSACQNTLSTLKAELLVTFIVIMPRHTNVSPHVRSWHEPSFMIKMSQARPKKPTLTRETAISLTCPSPFLHLILPTRYILTITDISAGRLFIKSDCW